MALRACAGVRACASIGGHRSLRSVHVCHAQIPDVNLTRRGVAGALAVSLVIATQPQPAQALGYVEGIYCDVGYTINDLSSLHLIQTRTIPGQVHEAVEEAHHP